MGVVAQPTIELSESFLSTHGKLGEADPDLTCRRERPWLSWLRTMWSAWQVLHPGASTEPR